MVTKTYKFGDIKISTLDDEDKEEFLKFNPMILKIPKSDIDFMLKNMEN